MFDRQYQVSVPDQRDLSVSAAPSASSWRPCEPRAAGPTSRKEPPRPVHDREGLSGTGLDAPGEYPGSGRNSAVFLSESCPWGNDCRRPGLEDRVRSSPVNVARKELAVLVAHHEIQRLKGLADCGRPERAFRSQLIYASGDCKFMIIARFNLRHNSPPVGGIKQPGLWFPVERI